MKIFALKSAIQERTLLAAAINRGARGVYGVAWIGPNERTLFCLRVSHYSRSLRAWWGRQERDWQRGIREHDGGFRL